MTHDQAVSHWRNRARSELKCAQFLFEKEDADVYGEVLFHCHLALELALKPRYIQENKAPAPFTHDLSELAEDLSMSWHEQDLDTFDEMTDIGVLSRYGDAGWYASNATKQNTKLYLQKTEQLFSKLLPQ